ncbi:hypothetical protein PVAG01_05400 [Phlyctema vagabunda]|uniref:3-keto-steroid reductase n=1 Tax=Phlyctema vagabunda TaxID=108571 RepID=A0ABR4PK97_9HELO
MIPSQLLPPHSFFLAKPPNRVIMGLPPWETSESQLFALVTGANSGLGFGIASRMIDEFISSPSTPPTKHIVLIVTTRSPLKTRFTISRLRAHTRRLAEFSPWARKQQKLAKAQGKDFKWEHIVQRVHFLGVEVDLCNLKSVYALADKLLNGTLGTADATTMDGLKLPAGSPGTQGYSKDIEQDRWALSQREGSTGVMRSWGWGLSGIKIPRLDVVICNAGIGGWVGLNWPQAIWTVLTDTVQATTWPVYKLAASGAVAKPQFGTTDSQAEEKQPLLNGEKRNEPALGEVFCANIFGHYILTHEVMPLLSRAASSSSQSGGKVIWISSIESTPDKFSLDDFQALKSTSPYESGKRLVDIMSLTGNLPSTKPVTKTYFDPSAVASPPKDQPTEEESTKIVAPKVYVAHPGVFSSEIMPLAWILVRFMELSFYLARWLGSPWHPITPYKAAVAPVWLALADEQTLASANADRSKWGSATDSSGNERVMRTEVGGWGWNGEVSSAEAGNNVERRVGRARDAVDATQESREEFEDLGAKCWKEMEVLRTEWEEVLDVKKQINYLEATTI